MKTKYLIIGSSAAGCSAVQAILEADRKSSITILSDEEFHFYSRPLLPYYLAGKIKEEDLFLADEKFCTQKSVNFLKSSAALKILPQKKKVLFEKGEIFYEKILIATGSKTFIPDIKGLEKIRDGVFTFMSLKDARGILNFVNKNKVKRAVVCGAGLIGLKCAEALAEIGIPVSVVEVAGRVLPRILDEKASLLVAGALKKAGVEILCGRRIESVWLERGKMRGVALADGEKISAEMLVLASGVRPAVEVIGATAIKKDKGILVNKFLSTNIKDIFAAGDVAQAEDFLSGEKNILAIWPVARRMGRIAGFNMAGGKIPYDGDFAMNSIEIGGVPTISVGFATPLPESGFEVVEKFSPEKKEYRKIVLSKGKIVGAVFSGNIDRVGIFTGLIRDRVDVTPFKDKLLEENFGFMFLPKEYRKKKFASSEVSVFN